MTEPPPQVAAAVPDALAVYVHLPWCVSKCPYCDFNSHTLRGALPEAEYIAALLADLDADLPLVAGRRVTSLFVGGGTPSLFTGRSIESLLVGIASRLEMAPAVEITLEVNPGTVEHGRLADYRAAGVNRLSIGAQSFDAGKLRALGRIHGPDEIAAAVAEARAGGFANINLDLMYGLPEQSPEQALADVRAALALEPTHLSHYQLTLEPNTRFHHQPPPLPDEETLWAIETACLPVLTDAGFQRYEVSAWALPDAQCRHNLAYWRFDDYLGLGAGAHGKLSLADGIRRSWRIAHPQGYLRAGTPRLAGERWLSAEDLVCEYLMNVLRLREGFTLAAFTARTGLAERQLAPRLERLRARGLMTLADGHWRASDQGYAHLDGLLAEFLPAVAAIP